MKITTVGIDLAKNVFQVHGVDERGHVMLKKQLKRDQMLVYFANLPACLIGMEACSGAHYWARQLRQLGHEVRLIAPQFVEPYVKGNKHDAADAAAICEAVSRPHMRFVPVKTEDQQAILAVHRVRDGFVKARTAVANQIRGLLSEFGLVLPQGIQILRHRLSELLDDATHELPELFRTLIRSLYEHFKTLDQQVQEHEVVLLNWHKNHADSQLLETIPGIGPITATALVASIGDIHAYENSRQLSAWIGLVPKQHSSGGKTLLQGISKRGDVYLRTLLIHGARAVVRAKGYKPDADTWLTRMTQRRPANVVAVAQANKTARIVWAVLTRKEAYQAPEAQAA